MATAFLGLDDHEFVKPSPAQIARRSTALFDSKSITVHTTAGDFTALLARDEAPSTSLQFARLAIAGVFNRAATVNSASEVRLTVPESESVRRLLEPLGDDRGIALKAGTIAYCSPTAAATNVTVRIIIGDHPVSDSRCIGFARVAAGADILRAIHGAPAGSSAFVSSVETSR